MKNLKIAILIGLTFFTSKISLAKNCTQYDVNNKKMEMVLDKGSATIKYSGFENIYHCEKKGLITSCYGDDDSGDFSYNKKTKTLTIRSLSFGEPDRKGAIINGKVKVAKSCN